MAEHSYKVVVKYNRLNKQYVRVQNTMYLTAIEADLAVFLQTLANSAAVVSFTVFRTIALPVVHTYDILTKESVKDEDLKKLL